MNKEDMHELLGINHIVQVALDKFETDKQYLKQNLLKMIESNEHFDNLAKHWFQYKKDNKLDAKFEESVANCFNNLVKNYEKLTCNNF
jgi:hypothetical protein